MKKVLLFSLLCILFSTHMEAQEYYYNYGTKKNIILNEDKVLINVSKDFDNWMEIGERICANVKPLFKHYYNKNFFLVYITRADLEKLMSLDFWEEDSKSIIITPGFFEEGDKNELIVAPQIIVNFDKEENIDLLTPYIEKYKLKISEIREHGSIYSRFYFSCLLYLTMDSNIGTFECANELFEKGHYIDSCPNVGYPRSGAYDPTAIPSLTSSSKETSTETFDLSGLKLASKPAKGIYIQNGKKRLGGTR